MQQRCMRAFCRAPAYCPLIRALRHSAHHSARRPLPLSPQRSFNSASWRRQDVVALRKELKDVDKASRALKRQGGLQDGRSLEEVEGWELTVGIEIHAQLNTARKLFSSASTSATETPNTRLEPFDLALPGSQPIFQYATLIPALRAALAFNCDIQPVSTFDRKHYFYHDQPSGYQITQYYQPFAKNGSLLLDERDGLWQGQELLVGIKQVQMEQDTARTRDHDSETSLVDFNRAGHPLIEIISLPHIHTPKAAAAYVRKVQGILDSVDALMAGLEMGGMRADVNVSVRRTDTEGVGQSYSGVTGLGQRTEIKNLNAFKGVEDAVRAERDRQIALLESGGIVEGETRAWSVTNPHTTTPLRSKEGEVDYRYMPDPDIPPLYIASDLVEHLYATMPSSPEQSIHILCTKYGLSEVDAGALLSFDGQERLYYFLDAVENLAKRQQDSIDGFKAKKQENGRVVGNWVLHELGSLLSTNDRLWTPSLVPAAQLARIIHLQQQNLITNVSAKQVLRMVFDGDQRHVKDIVRQEGLAFVAMSAREYDDLASKVIEEYPEHVKDIRESGKHGKIKFLLGQMMRQAEKGKIQATTAEQVLRSQIYQGPRRDAKATEPNPSGSIGENEQQGQ